MSIVVYFFCYIFASSEINFPSDPQNMFILFLNSLPVKVRPSLSEVQYSIENLSMEFGNFSNFQKLLVFNTETLKYSDVFTFNDFFTNRLCMITNNDIEHIPYTK